MDEAGRLRQVDLREPHGGPGHGRDLAGEPDQAERVAAVRLDVHVQDHVAVEVDEGDAQGRVRRQDQDPVRVAGQAQLVAGAEHPVADGAHLLGPLDDPVARQDGPGQGHGNPLARGDVRGAADDLEHLVAHPHAGQRETVGARMARHLQQLAGDDVAPVRAPALDPLDLHPEQREALGELLRVELDVDVVAEPGERDSHRKLPQEAQVAVEEDPDVRDPVAEHRDPLDAHPEGEALVPLRVDPSVLEDDRVDHPRAEDRHPARSPAGRAAGAAADEAADVEGDRRLGERVVAGPEAGGRALAEHRVGELDELALEVRQVRPLVHHQPFDLEELRRVRGVDRLVAEAAARQERPDRRLLGMHHAGSGRATCGSAGALRRCRRTSCPTGPGRGGREGC